MKYGEYVTIHTLSFKSSTILLIGGSKPKPLGWRVPRGPFAFLSLPGGKARGNSGRETGISGVAGADSPRAAVVGRKREAITTR
jgi:hypothetical protein